MKRRLHERIYGQFYNRLVGLIAMAGYYFLLSVYFIMRPILKLLPPLRQTEAEAYATLNASSRRPDGAYCCSPTPASSDMDLSIIIPAYNAEPFIRECLESVVHQKTKYHYEIIVINDGSTDQTGEILQKFLSVANLRILTQRNKGFSGARNTGIDAARGKYLMFVDSDDLLCGDAVEILMANAAACDADIVQGSWIAFHEKGDKNYFIRHDITTTRDSRSGLISVSGYPWAKVYRRELFKDVRFPVGFWYEDTIMAYVIFPRAWKYAQLSNVVYQYRINPNGISKSGRSSLKSIDTYWIVEEVLAMRQKLGMANNDRIYELTRYQLSRMLLGRIRKLDGRVKKAAFVLSCGIMDNLKDFREAANRDLLKRDLDDAFQHQKFGLWMAASYFSILLQRLKGA